MGMKVVKASTNAALAVQLWTFGLNVNNHIV